MECVLIDRWDMVELFLARGADPIINNKENTIESHRNTYTKVKSMTLSLMIDFLKNSSWLDSYF